MYNKQAYNKKRNEKPLHKVTSFINNFLQSLLIDTRKRQVNPRYKYPLFFLLINISFNLFCFQRAFLIC